MSQTWTSIETYPEYNQLNNFIDEIDELMRITLEKLINNGREKLDKWRDDSYQIINEIYQQKCEEFHQSCIKKISKTKKDLDQIRLKITEFNQEENNIDLLTLNIQHIKQKLKEIQQKDIQINIHSLSINKNLITIENPLINEFDISLLSTSYHTIHSSNKNSWSMSSNNQYLLIDQYPYLYLFDQNLKVINQCLWKYNHIYDICWSAILNKFIIITYKKIFIIDENLTLIEHIQTIKGEKWWSATCSNSSLYLTQNQRNTTIFQFNLLSSFELIKQWKPPDSCKQDEFICDITYHNEKLALIIVNSSNTIVNLILRSLITFDLLWSFQLNINYKWFQTAIRCCSINDDEWIIVEEYTSYIFHVDRDGIIKAKREYIGQPLNILLFGTNLLAIRTEKSIHFHKI